MSETKQPWTTGPFEASPQDRVLTGPQREEFASWIITADDETDDGMVVATVCADAEERTKANAILMAAAPELATALALFVRLLDLSREPGANPLRTAMDRDRCEKSARAALVACGWQWGGK